LASRLLPGVFALARPPDFLRGGGCRWRLASIAAADAAATSALAPPARIVNLT